MTASQYYKEMIKIEKRKAKYQKKLFVAQERYFKDKLKLLRCKCQGKATVSQAQPTTSATMTSENIQDYSRIEQPTYQILHGMGEAYFDTQYSYN